jgi:hypothetical protein
VLDRRGAHPHAGKARAQRIGPTVAPSDGAPGAFWQAERQRLGAHRSSRSATARQRAVCGAHQFAKKSARRVGAYKSLAKVEQAFRSLETIGIHLRPIFHRTAPWVGAHVLMCMLGYHVKRRQSFSPRSGQWPV